MSFSKFVAVAASLAALPTASHAVRLSTDGHGQALLYPVYTARTLATGNAQVTAFSVINHGIQAKAVRVRFLEGKAGAPVFDFNLFLSQYDVWTAGVVPAGPGAGIFTADNSCTSPVVSRNSQAPTLFRNVAYSGDPWGDSLDRTYEGYLEILEMGSVGFGSALEASITHRADFAAPNASRPSCAALPVSTAPAGLGKPVGGLSGSASFVNVNEGTDISVDALALSQWSDSVQWGAPGSLHPDLSDASPAVSTVVDTRDDGDVIIISKWTSGRDAVSAVLMVDRVQNEFTYEPSIAAATDWIVTMPTKRFYMNGLSGTAPFANQGTPTFHGQVAYPIFYDREEQTPGGLVRFCSVCPTSVPMLDFAATSIPWTDAAKAPSIGLVLGSRNVLAPDQFYFPHLPVWVNGWAEILLYLPDSAVLVAPTGQSTIVNALTGSTRVNANVTYRGLPAMGFSARSYSTRALPGMPRDAVASYGAAFVHKVARRIEIGN